MKFTPEQLVQFDCVQFTKTMCPQVLLSASQNGLYVGAKNVAAYITKMKMLGMLVGELDLMLTWPVKNILFCELKAAKKTTSDSQEGVIALRQKQGFDCYVAHSLVEYVEGLRRYGVPIRAGFDAGIGRL